jgi:hypothetical protein
MFSRLSRRIPLTVAALLAILMLAPAAAQAQRVEWRGFAYLYDFTEACAEYGWGGRIQMNVRYRPSGLADNGTSSRLSFFDDFYAFGLVLDNGAFSRRWQSVGAAGLGSSPYVWPDNVRLRVPVHQPRVDRLSASTPQVRLAGQIRNFDELRGCDVSFDATMLLRQ